MLELDHVVLAVSELEAGAAELASRHGLASVAGGRHPGWGTANRIVPLGDTYLELVAVIDRAEAERSVFGRWVARARARSPRPLGWAVRTDNIESAARQHGLTVASGVRQTARGELSWRLAGLDEAAAEPARPFFIEWAPATAFPGRAPVDHAAGRVRLRRLQLSGVVERLSRWLGAHELPISYVAGASSVERVVLEADGRDIVLACEP